MPGAEFDWGGTSVKTITEVSKGQLSVDRNHTLEHKDKSWLDPDVQYDSGTAQASASSILLTYNEFLARGVRKVTTGITGLWSAKRS